MIMADTNKRLQQAIAAARAGNTSEAKILADQLVGEDPENAHALFLRGMLADNLEEQKEYIEKVLVLDPDHKAANKRMAQIASQEEAAAPVEEPVEEIPEVEMVAADEVLDETVVAAAVAGSDLPAMEAEETLAEEAVESDMAFEEAVEAPLEEMDEAAADIADAEFAVEEDTVSDGVAETLVAGALIGEALDAEPLAEDDEVPDWLFEEARSEEELLGIDEADLWGEETDLESEELPDWLQEEPVDDFEGVQSEEELLFATGEPEEEAFTIETAVEEFVEEEAEPDLTATELAATGLAGVGLAADEATDQPEVVETPKKKAPPKRKKKKANRSLEILLAVLIIIALIVVGGLAYLIISPPF
jgi:tetratricopeptide (TPR) repeat protein